ncbi:MAG: phage virion morphogenesis protein [Candidatus Gastranaerophilales bacterium]|nr:phage virion morphogenesis protein [Candidatus Gastranaerophilales bacterium]
MRGELASSITSKYANNSAIVGTNKVCAAIHQFGGDAGKNKKVKIPARPYLMLGDVELDNISKIIKNYLK